MAPCEHGHMDTGVLIGWGYEGRDTNDLREALATWRIDALADVRLTPISRKAGFSKSKLRELCESAGVDYLHLKELGNPKDNRPGYATSGAEGMGARNRFRETVLSTEVARASLVDLAERRDRGDRVLVLCFEADEACCHRQEVLHAVRDLEVALA